MEIRLAPLPKGYQLIRDDQSADQTTIARIEKDGTTSYWRVVVKPSEPPIPHI